MGNEYVFWFKDSSQISPDDWRVFSQMVKFSGETTLDEVMTWYKSVSNDGSLIKNTLSFQQIKEATK